MKKYAYAAALLVAATPLLFGCANAEKDKTDTTAAKSKPAPMICLRRHDIDGWGMRDDGKMVVSGTFRDKYLLTVKGWCQDLDFSFGIDIRSPGHIQDMCIDRGDYVIPVGNPSAMPGPNCYITKIERYTKAMQADYRKARAEAKAKKARAKAEKAAAEAKKAAADAKAAATED